MRTAALLLGAGLSRRAGGVNKLLVRDAAGVPMIRRAAQTALASGCFAVVAVLGHEAREVGIALGGLAADGRLRSLRVEDPAEGIAASLAAGLEVAARLGAEAAAVCLGDMPDVRPATIDALVAHLAARPAALGCVPCWQGQRGNPVVWRAAAFEQLASLRGDRGGRQLIGRLQARMLMLDVADDGVTVDFDTPERLAWFTARNVPPPP